MSTPADRTARRPRAAVLDPRRRALCRPRHPATREGPHQQVNALRPAIRATRSARRATPHDQEDDIHHDNPTGVTR